MAPEERGDFEVFPENWNAFGVFVSCATQWRISEGPTGLDYQAVESVMRIYEIEDKRDTFERVRVMESSAISEFIKRRKR